MSRTIVIVGFGPGVSTAVAEKFAAEGFDVALVARSHGSLIAGVAALEAKGATARAYQADASDPVAIGGAIARARAELGPIGVLHWNAYGGHDVRDLLTTDPLSVREVFDVAVVGLLAAIQEALVDLKSDGSGAVLVTNGAFGLVNPMMDQLALALNTSGVALANAAKHKLVGLLAQRLTAEGVYVGEVMIAGAVKGTGWAEGQEGIEASAVAAAFWTLYQARTEIRAQIS
jgi:NAD(P)-dependent dehydrogenase (short-subunit alcohol dehydrogenase family)